MTEADIARAALETELAEALILAREYVERVHRTISSAMGHERTLVKPDLDKIDAALSRWRNIRGDVVTIPHEGTVS